ncbi:cobyrinate a,c-diamide synthase [uncultured Clostridium sp.]|uniref:cobyrinate a,c-diamide synthase n=1 Tax=uncultured Clostridium sp. TaxID=59620 RepID=UPI0025FA25E2|nr:cobyrinate a,c-diamide synthase [uncultured Clostridium sp.]
MKSIIIGSDFSGGGKTTFTLGLMKALKNRKLDVQGYKVGPDYIDPAFHKEVTETVSQNLDVHLMGEDGVKYSYSRGKGEVGVIEGVMGLYDGIGAGEEASTYEVSKILDNMPIILVLSPKGQSSTICAVIKGLKEYRNANIAGIVLNSISEKYYKLLKYSIEKNCGIKVFGYMPKNEEISLNSRHLGLVQSMEVLNLKEKLEICGAMVEEYVDVDGIIDSMKEFHYDNNRYSKSGVMNLQNKNLRIGVAKDKAFSFYYKDNIELLENIGQIIYFSPINDEILPENLDFLYIGGGYPEVFKEELSKNQTMRRSIKKALDKGLRCYAECGGLMYLTDEIEGSDMAGFFKGKSFMTKRLQNFGYCQITIDKKLYGRELSINAHEFHKSYVELDEETIYTVEKKQYDGKILKWNCGYAKKNTLAGYAHINFMGNIDFFKCISGYNMR